MKPLAVTATARMAVATRTAVAARMAAARLVMAGAMFVPVWVPWAAFAPRAFAAPLRDEPRLSRAIERCTRLAELIACDEALSLKPNDPDLLVAEGDVLVLRKRPGEAIGVYRNALRLSARADAVNPKILVAQSQRSSFLDTCVTQSGAAAERACESAWLPGAPDEVTVFKRRGFLLQTDNQPAAALDAYLAAARLRPADRSVARAVVSLSGSPARKDPATMTARGSALMILGRRPEAMASWREALRIAPDFAPAKAQLHLAERSASEAAVQVPGAPAGPNGVAAEARDMPPGPYSNAAEDSHSN